MAHRFEPCLLRQISYTFPVIPPNLRYSASREFNIDLTPFDSEQAGIGKMQTVEASRSRMPFCYSRELPYVDRTDITEIIIILVCFTYLIKYAIRVYFMEVEEDESDNQRYGD